MTDDEVAAERWRVRDAPAAYQVFIDAHPEERKWLSEWDGADLAAPPARGTANQGSTPRAAARKASDRSI